MVQTLNLDPGNFGIHAGDLATVFMLEDRVSARTNAGGDSNEFDPGTAPDSGTIAQNLVGNVSVSNWASNATIESGMRALRVLPTSARKDLLA